MSSRYWLLRSPNPGALSAAIFNDPLSLFTTSVAKASCSISSAIIKIGYPPLIASSRTLMRSLAFVIFLSTRSNYMNKICQLESQKEPTCRSTILALLNYKRNANLAVLEFNCHFLTIGDKVR